MRSITKVVTQCAAAWVVWALGAPAGAQEPPQQFSQQASQQTTQQPAQQSDQQSDQQNPAIKSQVNLVNIFATVRDKQKHIMPSLKKEDFRIFENDQEQKIAFFSAEKTLPVTLGLLIDTSGSEQNRLPAEQEAATRFLNRVLRKGDEAMVISFDVDVDLLSDFTEDRAQLDRAIRSARINAPMVSMTNPGPLPPESRTRGLRGTAFYDAIWTACGDKLATEAGRKALVIITDADDQGSKVRVEEAIEAAQRTNTVVHILLVHDPGFGWRPDIAHKISDSTGGRVIEVSSAKHLDEAFDQISEELRTEYTLGYYPTNSARDGTFRKIKVETTDKDLKVLARKGYYAPKDEGAPAGQD
ncbi:MAG TPA: VWA domain-containing protein [Candidatus Acidoferrum sp.]|nr:VWA domain-containing protein [Candidatus Acidoferrum sp.]